MVPPDPIPNSEVKRRCADGSVGLPHVRVGHRQVLNVEPRAEELGVFVFRLDFNKLKVRSKSEDKINRNRIMPRDSDGKATKSERRRCFREIHQVLYLAYQPFLFNGSNTNMSNLAKVSIIMIQIPITTTPAEILL